MQALLKLVQDQDESQISLAALLEAFDIEETAPPAGHEYLNSITYFLAIGNSLYQIQTVSLQAKAMEEYLTWLLRDRTRVIGDTHAVELQAEFDRAQVGDDELTSIQIGGLVPETVRVPEEPQATHELVDVVEHGRIGDAMYATLATAKQLLRQTPHWREVDSNLRSLSGNVADPNRWRGKRHRASETALPLRRDRWFESGSLHRRV
jgi:hypothetical protein